MNALDKEGKWTDADIFVVANGSINFNKLDWMSYAGSTYELRMTQVRRWQGSGIFAYAAGYARTGS
jgi:hypothetical protein